MSMDGRSRPRIAIIGHVDAGKTSLTATITKVLSEVGPGHEVELPVRRPGLDRERIRDGLRPKKR